MLHSKPKMRFVWWRAHRQALPAMALSMLDLPQPEGPTMSKELPACKVMSRLRQRWRECVGVKMLRRLSVRPAWPRCVRTICEDTACLSVKAAGTMTLLSVTEETTSGRAEGHDKLTRMAKMIVFDGGYQSPCSLSGTDGSPSHCTVHRVSLVVCIPGDIRIPCAV